MAQRKILLVDDEQPFRELIGIRVKSWGYALVEADCGKEAIAALKSKGPDIVVLDYLMPGLDGIQTLRQIRKANKDVPVIMFTAYADMQIIKDTQELGVAAFIPKLSAYADSQAALKSALDMIEKELSR